jgi:Carboxypeptidase regulatory-like domain/TonB-dependent Receptor Plug Domain
MRQSWKYGVAGLVLLTLVLVGTLGAQTTKGTIAGVVTDAQGLVVSGANVTAAAIEGGDVRSTTTGGNGEYRIEALNIGRYTVTVKAKGFAETIVQGVMVNASVITATNVELKIAAGMETVTVEAGAETIQTESGELSKTIPQVDVRDLPYTSLNPYQLAVSLPGVVTVASRDDMTNGQSFSVNGLRPRSNNFLIDGFDNNDNSIMGQAFQPNNIESVQEVAVLTNSYSAEYGRGGGSVSNLTFRSGNNNFHGAAWEQYSGSDLNAVSAEESMSGLTRPAQFVNNIFGFRFGGPAIKNKLFFFGTAQWNRYFGAQSTAAVLTLPTAAGYQTLQSIGSNSNVDLLLSALGNLRAPNADGSVDIGGRTGCPAPCTVDYGYYQRSDTGKSLGREWTVRADYAGTNDTFLVRYTDSYNSLFPDLYANNYALPYADTMQGGPARLFGTMWSHTFSPTLLNEFRFSAQQLDFAFAPTAATEANPMAHLPQISLWDTMYNVYWGGYSGGSWPQGRGHKTLQLQDAVSWTRGTHTMKFGADLAILLIKDQIPFNADGTMAVSGGGDCSAIGLGAPGEDSCTDLANYIDGYLGSGGSISKQFGNPRISVPTTQQAYYFQDSWKIRPNLTLDYGLRYEYQPPEPNNVLMYPSLNRSTFVTDPFMTRHEVSPDRNNFGPRFGFAYTPKFWSKILGENKTVLRGGWGMYYDAFFTNISDNTASTFPNTLGGAIIGGEGRGLADPIGQIAAITAEADPGNTVNSVTNKPVNPLTYQWNLNLQRELPASLKMEVAYVGTRGERLFGNEQWNPRVLETVNVLNPRLVSDRGSVLVRANRGDSNYHGLQTTVTRQVGSLALRGAYTWSRSIDNGSEVFTTSGGTNRWMDVNNPRSDRGPSAFHRTNRAVFSYTYEFPNFKDKGFLTYVLGGWGTSGVVSFQSGTPETMYLGSYDQYGDGEVNNDRPSWGNRNAALDYSSACRRSGSGCITGLGFDDGSGNLIDYFSRTPGSVQDFRYIVHPRNSGIYGNVSRNSYYFPGRQDWNLSVVKRIPMPYAEGHQFELRLDMFNAFNHPNLGVSGLNGNVLSPTFLDIASTKRGGRTMAVWAKYSF